VGVDATMNCHLKKAKVTVYVPRSYFWAGIVRYCIYITSSIFM
jgi:hypothetical protein